ncbi:MAG: DNA adenine methylase [Spirochaetales bacterium]|nr:DNA adenine methylase [Spirochaetales bacterium]
MKTPLTYYGGKQQLASLIISLIPEHRLYCEPFVGGGAVFFKKAPSPVEVVNDINSELVNFYEVVKNDFVSLEKEIRITLHSRDQHRKATVIYNNPDMFDKVKRAWALWVMANESYSGKLDGTFGYDRKGQTSKTIMNKRDGFTMEYAERLQNVQIECTGALRIIRSYDALDSFFYLDPPYFNSDMGHYDGYTKEDFIELLESLAQIKGKFLLSSYPSDILNDYREKNNWTQIGKIMSLAVSHPLTGKKRQKRELLTANYHIEEQER